MKKECTKENPMLFEEEGVVYMHKDAEETGFETETKVEYRCPNCGRVFIVDLGS